MKRLREKNPDWIQALGLSASSVVMTWLYVQERQVHKAWKHYTKARGSDAEALHDLRVEVRRLRVWLRNTRDLVRTSRAGRQALKELARASNPVRDHEVMVGLLRQCAGDEAVSEAAQALLQRYEQEGAAVQPVRFVPKEAELKPKPRHADSMPFGHWLADRIEAIEASVSSGLDQGEAQLHPVRIDVKHLRYLTEPLQAIESASDLVKLTKKIQTHLGDINDLIVFRAHLPMYAQWQIDTEVAPWLLEHGGRQERPLQRGFTRVRDRTIALTAWQTDQLQGQMDGWRTAMPDLRRQLTEQVALLVGQLRDLAGSEAIDKPGK